jgi:hypothetical protein
MTTLFLYHLIWLLLPPPLPSVISTGDTQEDCDRETTCCGERGSLGAGAKSHDGEKAWSSIKHFILSGVDEPRIHPHL